MKKIIILLSILFVVAISCDDDILDKQPLGIISDETVWNDKTLMDSYLAQIYYDCIFMENDQNPLNGDPLNNWFGRLMINEVSDECYTQWVPHYSRFKWGNLDVSGGLLEWWETSYKIIRKLNEFIERVPIAPVDATYMEQRIAEARFLRAFNYFTLVKRYGGVPLITSTQQLDDPQEELFPSRNKESEVYDFIINELADIKDVLPERQAAEEIGRPNRYAALSLQSRAALYAASIAKYGNVQLNGIVGIDGAKASDYYKTAYDAANEIMTKGGFSLYKKYDDKTINFRNLFLDESDNPEAIFTIIHDSNPLEAGGRGTYYDYFQAPWPNFWGLGNQDQPYLEMVEEFEYIDGRSGKLDRTAILQRLWTTEELWGDKDPRFAASIYTQNTQWKGAPLDFHKGLMLPGRVFQLDGSYEGILALGTQNPNGTGFGVLKYLDESNDLTLFTGNSKTDYIVFRYAETLLNYAEAAFELGQSDQALVAVNEVRERAGISKLDDIDLGKIQHERKVELFAEGHRYWDARRWRIATDVLSINQSGLQYVLDTSTKKYWLSVIPNIDPANTPPKFYEKNYYFPITPGRRGQNPNLVENPGY